MEQRKTAASIMHRSPAVLLKQLENMDVVNISLVSHYSGNIKAAGLGNGLHQIKALTGRREGFKNEQKRIVLTVRHHCPLGGKGYIFSMNQFGARKRSSIHQVSSLPYPYQQALKLISNVAMNIDVGLVEKLWTYRN